MDAVTAGARSLGEGGDGVARASATARAGSPVPWWSREGLGIEREVGERSVNIAFGRGLLRKCDGGRFRIGLDFGCVFRFGFGRKPQAVSAGGFCWIFDYILKSSTIIC